jgi:glycerol-3-phosphate dehydrogenase
VPFSFKPILNAPLKAVLKRTDFVKLVKWLATFEPGKGYVENRPKLAPAFADQESIAKLAVDLTERDLQGKGSLASRREIQGHVNTISCRYDYELHRIARGAIFNIITHLFETRSLADLYVSEDKRELRHLGKLRAAQADGVGVVYLVNHTSHFDEFILDIFLDSLGLPLPLFAAGLNMMFTPSLTKIFMLGSYVIIRKGASRSYLAALHHYCQALAEMGKPQGIFLEAWSGGARTRDGSIRIPRRLVTIQGSLSARGDVLVQPVALSYSRVPEDLELSEGSSLASWANGNHCLKGLLKNPLHPVKGLAAGFSGIYGRTFVSFGEGRLLSELKAEWSRDPQGLELDEHAALYAIREIARDKKVMASHLAALALANAGKKGSNDLEAVAAEALEEIRDYHQRVFESEPDLEDFIRERPLPEALEDGLASLRARNVVGGRPFFGKGLPKVKEPHGLSYYATHSDRRLYSPSAKENIVVCSVGEWGYAMAWLLGKRTLNDRKFHNSSLSLYNPSEEDTQSLGETRVHQGFQDLRLPKNVFPTSDAVEAFRKANQVVVATPPSQVAATLGQVFGAAKALKCVILASRGFDPLSHRLPIQIAWEASVAAGATDVGILALSGPFLPRDLVDGEGGLWVLAGAPREGSLPEASLFRNGDFGVFVSDDPIGVQVAAALSDAYALYGAYLKCHKELRDAKEMATFVRELSGEAKRLALALGARPATFDSDNPAWNTEFLLSALSWSEQPTLRQAAISGREYLVSLGANDEAKAAGLWPDRALLGYNSIRSAYLIGKNLALSLPHLERAYGLFQGAKG